GRSYQGSHGSLVPFCLGVVGRVPFDNLGSSERPQPNVLAMIRRLVAVEIDTAIVMLLPFGGYRRGARSEQFGIELVSARGPRLVLGSERRIILQCGEPRRPPLHFTAPQRKNVAIGFTSLEANCRTRSREQPVHREAVGRPVGLDDARKRRDRVLRPV